MVDDARQHVSFDTPEVIAALQWSVDAAQQALSAINQRFPS